MPSRIKCPECENAYAYSPALLGKTVRCRQCQHQFTITAPPPDEAPAPAAGQPAPAPAPSAPTPALASKPAPPPLPAAGKGSKSGDTSSRPGVSAGKRPDMGSKSGVSRRPDEDEDDDRPSVGDRGRDDDRPSRRRAEDDDRPSSRGRDRDDDGDEEDRPSRRKADRARPRPAPAPERESSPLLLIGLIAAFVIGFLIIAAGIGYLLWPSSTPSSTQAPVGPAVMSDPMAAADPPKNLDEIIKNAPNRNEVEAGPPPAGRPEVEPPRFDPPRNKRAPRGGAPAPPAVNPPGFEPPRFDPPAFPGGPPNRPKPDLAAPKFAPVEPLPITPTPLTADRIERTMPGPIEHMVVAGGGRLLLLHLPGQRQVAVVDVSKGERVKLIPAGDPGAMVAAGMNLFVIYLPEKGVLERWNCKTLEREAELKAEFGAKVKALAMGPASNGPLVALLGAGRNAPLGGATLGYFDPMTGKEVAYEVGGARNEFGLGLHKPAEVRLRVSADGSVATGFGGGPGPQVDVIEGGRLTRHAQHLGPEVALPGPDGRTLYGRGLRYPVDIPAGRGPRDDPRNPVWLIPAVHGDYFVSLHPVPTDRGNPFQPRKAVADVCLGAEGKSILSLGELPDFELVSGLEGRGKTYDEHLAFVPDAKVLAMVSTKARERLILKRADPDAGLSKAGFDYLFVASRPPTVVVKGEVYRYAVMAKSKKGGVKVTLERGPKGMAVTSAGAVSWDVPEDFGDPEAGVVLKVTDAGGKEVVHAFRLVVRGNDGKGSTAKGK